ncbi:MAG: hypothetical protein UU82_C0042G0007 [Candidatus Nomurabacteria bacterium GW2011_GWC2_41_8]|uniref:EamA domain-containing protein n=3 Tax=Candidatus Nomuraibacteriota TaxID=1752729 RepID=A0A1F6YC73_9BACT|nr:MAG: hypothetical protein UU58_C0014G0009 [Candidatus Nomurabacteria bacterium GW2011_GWA2_41_25]KKS23046.1 MAG: hypothetical protein UU82_C0042G0007 [Candidatus Nomurabacteria bacterium GW2011_GWC2_41_8]OGI67570.1 MAG: hypothetical protein A2823_02990 [Candidatus Nomurabacteria bacterium RIFCSPHIGHO2_01_FULL_41_91]OGI80200.1 MAG: hypothetical protein A3D43_03225 [Candidatus Nomurabacteria bacterium RIFCSPHIGHO2_02_FULL_41_52]OGI85264.1 MAG: hypothetical protein A3F49_01085 [Candidatus Nomur
MWFYAALLMSLLTGIYVVISKHTIKNMDPVIFYWVIITASTPFVFMFAWKNGIPTLDYMFFIGVFGSAIFYTASKIIFWKTIKNSLLSEIYPLISIGPIFTLILSIIILSEKVSLYAFLGSGITLLGIYILNVSSAREGLLKPFKVLYQNKLAFLMMVSIFIGSVVSIFDKIAINHTFSQNFLFVVLVEDLIIILGLLPWMLKKKKIVIQEIITNGKLILLLAVIFSASNIVGFFALANGNPGLVSSVFRTQVFFVFLFGYFFLKDRPKLEAIIGTIIMILGLVVLKLGS